MGTNWTDYWRAKSGQVWAMFTCQFRIVLLTNFFDITYLKKLAHPSVKILKHLDERRVLPIM